MSRALFRPEGELDDSGIDRCRQLSRRSRAGCPADEGVVCGHREWPRLVDGELQSKTHGLVDREEETRLAAACARAARAHPAPPRSGAGQEGQLVREVELVSERQRPRLDARSRTDLPAAPDRAESLWAP